LDRPGRETLKNFELQKKKFKIKIIYKCTADFENEGYYFFAGKLHKGPFKGYFEGDKTFQKSRGLLEISREIALYVVCPKPKKNVPNFQNQRCIGIFMSLLSYAAP
jgi:hypothetical protein